MSEHLAAAKELVRSAIGEIETRLAEIQLEIVDLHAARSALLVALNGDASVRRESSLEMSQEVPVTPPAPKAKTPTPPAPARDTGLRDVDAANRVIALLTKRGGEVPAADVHAATKLATWASKRLLKELAAAKRIVLIGWAAHARYRLPGVDAPAALEGDRGAGRRR